LLGHFADTRLTVLVERLILTYLIPCHLLTTHTLPTQTLLAPYPRLQKLFLPLSRCIKRGDLSGFDSALVAGEDEFVKRRIYLTLERGRDIALRNLLRKVFITGGFEESKDNTSAPVRRTRIPVAEFGAAISIGSKERMDNDEVECLLANMIYKVRALISYSFLPTHSGCLLGLRPFLSQTLTSSLAAHEQKID
jgi:COP9 signalosome complex subunit 12